MEVVSESNIVSDRIKAFLDDPQWPEHIKDPQETDFFKYIIILEIL